MNTPDLSAAHKPDYSSVVVATDFTPCSGAAITEAARLAAAAKAPLHIVHVIDTLVMLDLEAAISDLQSQIRLGLVAEAKTAWSEFSKSVLAAAGRPIEVVVNNRVVGILHKARQDKADLLVLGAFGTRSPDIGMGTVATGCVRQSPCDVLIVRDTKPGGSPFRRVVAAVDFSPTSMLALNRAARIAARDAAELHILHVFQPPWHQLQYRKPSPVTTEDQQWAYRDNLKQRLAAWAKPVSDRASDVRTTIVVHDDSGHRSGIVEYAVKSGADLVVLGTRGRTNLRDVLLGSTAEKTLRDSKCSVLAVKPDSEIEATAADESTHAVQLRGPA